MEWRPRRSKAPALGCCAAVVYRCPRASCPGLRILCRSWCSFVRAGVVLLLQCTGALSHYTLLSKGATRFFSFKMRSTPCGRCLRFSQLMLRFMGIWMGSRTWGNPTLEQPAVQEGEGAETSDVGATPKATGSQSA